ncbi:MAG TPA: hypothetical protein VEK14_08545, partial [Rhodomicrobium sp.]|nr:hypothetical protein [Rhodomicrobium sp.]
LIYDRWPGSKQDEDPPFTFTVPCPTPECRGKYALNVLQAEREVQREDAFCDARRPHRHPVAKLLYDIDLPTAVAEIRRSTLDNRTFGRPPRLLEIGAALQKNLNAVKGLTKESVQIQLYCELSEELAPSAVDIIEVDKDWVAEVRKWMPWIAGKFATLHTGPALPDGDFDVFKDLPKDEDKSKDAAGKQLLKLPKGRLMRPDGQILTTSVADKLIAIANKGEMRQTLLSDGRWVWASKEEADRNDPTIPKER